MIKVAVFDDNDSRRDGLKLILNFTDDMKCVGTFADCRNVEQNVNKCNPDVVLMDINMPYVNGIEGVKILKNEFPGIKIIMQTIFEEEEKIIASIAAGADGYIMKQKSPLDLIEGIRQVLNGGAPITPRVAKKILKLFGSRVSPSPKKREIQFTRREQEILNLLVEGYSYKMIADKCNITHATVNSHIGHIYKKLQVNSAAAAVAKALKEKLV
ncbi:MAG: response regulator transcription factor [Bacteroidota bacterium]